MMSRSSKDRDETALACLEKMVGEETEIISVYYGEDVTEEEVLSLIRKQNADPSITGILVQLPVPKHISEKHINETITPINNNTAIIFLSILPISSSPL